MSAPALDDFWADKHIEFTDTINDDIWNDSPAEQLLISDPATLRAPGSIGAQQAMLDAPPLPWVPDVLGQRWREPESIIIVGSAYAPFLQGISRRDATLPVAAYLTTASDPFLRSFLQGVVRPDADYYGKIAQLAQDQQSAAGIALFDLCRASFTIRGTRANRDLDRAAEYTFKPPKGSGQEGKRRATASRQLFTRYVESTKQRDWTTRRLEQTPAHRILALGSVAEHGLLRFFFDLGVTDVTKHATGERWSPKQYDEQQWVLHYARPRQTLGQWLDDEDWWVIKGMIGDVSRTWHLLPTLHPCRNNDDPDYQRTRALLRKL